MLGTLRWVSPCRLLPPAVVRKSLAGMGKYALYEQEYEPATKSIAQMKQMERSDGYVHGTCSIDMFDKAQGRVELTVDQYATAHDATAYWRDIKRLGNGSELRDAVRAANRNSGSAKDPLEQASKWFEEFNLEATREEASSSGGVPVKGLDPSILYVPGDNTFGSERGFVGHYGTLVLTLTHSEYANVKNLAQPRQVRDAMGFVRAAFTAMYRNAADSQLSQAEVPAWWTRPAGWAPFAQPCGVLSPQVLKDATGVSGVSEIFEASVALRPKARLAHNSTPGYRAVDNECERSIELPDRRGRHGGYVDGDVKIFYAAAGDSAYRFLNSVVARDAYEEPAKDLTRWTHRKVANGDIKQITIPGADAAYLLDWRKLGLVELYAQVGRAVLGLIVYRSSPTGDDVYVPNPALERAATRAVGLLTSVER